MSPLSINLLEVGPRDGLQNESRIVPTEVKIEMIERLMAAGVRRLEVTSFVNPRRVPQMADAEAVLAGLPARDGVSYIGLVLNRKGFERARDAGCHEVGMAIVASDTFNRRNQGVDTRDSVAAWLEIAREAHSCGIRPHITLSTAFGCPFEGEIDPKRVLELAQECARGDPTEIALADTVGVAVPSQVSDLFGRLRELLPGIALRGHFHNTRNTGIANAYAAVMAGVETLDASVGGIGGCPFAPAATGNIATEDVLYMLDRMGVRTGVALAPLMETSRWVQEQLGRPVPGMLLKAGAFPRAESQPKNG